MASLKSITTLSHWLIRQIFETFWLSNQGKLGIYDASISALAQYADNVYFTKEGSYFDSKASDFELLPKIEDALQNKASKKLIIIHIMGSHPSFCHRIQGRLNYDFFNRERSCYVQSIEHTDALIAKINLLAQRSQKNYSLIYVSDHGLSQKRNSLYHDTGAKQSYEVPLFITGSKYHSRELQNQSRSGFSFITLLAEIMGISAKQLADQPSFF